MNKEQILQTIKDLAKCQGFYGRILSKIENASPNKKEQILSALEKQNFNDPVDLVLFFEC